MNKMLRKASIRAFFLTLIIVTLAFPSRLSAQSEIETCAERASFLVKFKQETCPYRVMAVFVLPGEELTLETVSYTEEFQAGECLVQASAGEIVQTAPHLWAWTAPQDPGLFPLTIRDIEKADSIVLNAFVMVPASHSNGEYLNGYRIGTYPRIPLKHLQLYKKPEGFVEVTEEIQDTLVSPHFTLKQFVCKQKAGYPRYLVLQERLLLKLELILERLNEQGYPCRGFHVLSGYRTPYYNRRIGNVRYSRHVWGGAADIFVDEDGDEMMDDLNKDGRIDYRDADVIFNIVDGMFEEPWYQHFIGGLGRYKKTKFHGPFVHVDVRGFRARW